MLVSLNGVRTDPEAATLSIFDRGFLFGDAIYEVICVYAGRPFQLAEHLARLEQSGAAIGLEIGPLRDGLTTEIEALVAELPADATLYVRVMITRGRSPDFDLLTVEGPPLQIVMVKPLQPWDPRMTREGLRLLSVGPEEIVGRIAPWVKSNNRQANLMAHRRARERGCDDALLVDPTGNISEGPSWNIFCVHAGEVVTPLLARGILPGITRSTVLGLCAEQGIRAHEREIPLAKALTADEWFITSTTRGVMPVAVLDHRAPGDPPPGPVTQRLAKTFRDLVDRA